MGGYVSSIKAWESFYSAWSELLNQENVTTLHRVEVENFTAVKKFARWDREHQVEIIKKAHLIIKQYTEAGVGGAVIQSDFDVAMPDVIKRVFGGAYGWLVQESLVGVAKWAAENHCKGPIQYVFETGAKGRHQVEHMMPVLYDDLRIRQQLRIGGWSFLPKENVKQLQAADWFAYELYKQMDNRIVNGPKRPIRKSALDLFRPGIDKAHYWDKQRLQKWGEKAPRLIRMLEDREKALLSIGRKDLI